MNISSNEIRNVCLYIFSIPFLIFGQDAKTEWNVNQTRGDYAIEKINVNEGTWMNIDVSPDGKTIVFDLLGDIYTMPISGGQATQLSTDIPWQMQPRFSQDGKFIVYTSDEGGGENIWRMDVNGQNQKAITNETFRMLNSPALSPDGKHVVVRKHFTGTRSLGAGEIWRYSLTDRTGKILIPRPNQQKDMGEPVYSPDGRYIYYSQDTTPGDIFEYSKDSEQGIYTIKRLDLKTGNIVSIISGRGGAIRPTPSPDGTKLAYISRVDFQSTLFVYDLSSGKKTAIYSKLDRDKQASWAIHGVYPTMAWTPNSKNILFWAGGKITMLNLESNTTQIINFAVNTEKVISETLRFSKAIDQELFEPKMLRNVMISPDESQVVFEALGYIYKRDLPNGKPSRLTNQKDHFEFGPSYSRDGKYIVFSTWDDQEQGNIHLVSSKTGKGISLLKEPGKYVEATFSPNGETIVYRKVKGGYITDPSWGLDTGVYTVSKTGGVPQLITPYGRNAHYANTNDHIYVHRDNTMPEFVRIDLNNKEEQTLYTVKYATEFKLSPNGQHLAFIEHYKVKLTPLQIADKPILIDQNYRNVPITVLSQRAGSYISFNSDSSKIYWSLGPELYYDNIAKGSSSTNPDKFLKATNISFKQPIDFPKGKLALVGAQIATMEGDEIIASGVIVVEGNHIIAVGAKTDVSIPSDATVIDVSGKTIIPGIIDTHSHGQQGISEIIPGQNWINYAAMAFGVTTIFNPNTDTSEIFAASEMQQAGLIVAPRIFSTGKSLYGAYEPGHTAIVNNLDDARFHMDRLKAVGVFAIKMHHHPRREQYQQIIQAAREYQMMVLSEGGALLQQDLGKIADGASSIEHSVSLAQLYDDVLTFWSHSEAANVPTLVVAFGGISGEHYWYDTTDVWKHPILSIYVPQDILAPRAMRRTKSPEHHYNHFNVVKIVKNLNDRGVLIGIGGHGQREGLGAHWELWMMAQGGMTPHEALKTATIFPARHLGLDQHIGSIKVGKLADLVVIDGDVLRDIRQSDNVLYIMQNGRLYESKSMNEIGNYDKKRKPFYFEN